MENTKSLGPSFTRLWLAAATSALGDGAFLASVPLLAAKLTHDPMLIGAVGATTVVPWFLFGLQAGALVDRWDRRKVMWRVDLARFLVVGLLAIGVFAGVVNIYLLIVAGFLLGVGQTFFDVSAQALIPAVVSRDPDALIRANGRMTLALNNGERLIGPPLGSTMFSVTRGLPFVFDSVSFLFSALVIRAVPGDFSSGETTRRRLRTEIAEGLRWLWGHRVLRALALTAAVNNLVYSATIWLVVLLAQRKLGLGDVGYGLLLSTEAVGGLIGGAVVKKINSLISVSTIRVAGMIIEGICIGALAFVSDPWMAGALIGSLGFCRCIIIVVTGTLRQRLVEPEMLGRVLSTSRMVSLAGMPFGGLLGGYLMREYNIGTPFALGGILLIVTAFISMPALSNHAIAKAENVPSLQEQEDKTEV
ncbi:MFS transporter [Actinomadura meridiana]|uniref:MFS transporter n=1 Tax=Actinomadura meridiana TaxID=559626 RepID=A0ABP8CJV9_9ACTN